MKIAKILGWILAIYVLIGLTFDGLIGYFQPENQSTVVLRTYNSEGDLENTVLGLRVDGDQLWVESGHWFRGWYNRILDNPNVILKTSTGEHAYKAVPVEDPQAVELMENLMGKGDGYSYWLGRAMLLFAPIKPVRLDLISPENNLPGRVEVQHMLGVSADQAWTVLSDFSAFNDWALNGEGMIEIEGQGIGMIRHLGMDGLKRRQGERLDLLDMQTRTLGYSLVYGSPIGMATYSATVSVLDVGDDRCILQWEGLFSLENEMDSKDVAGRLKEAYKAMSTALQAHILKT